MTADSGHLLSFFSFCSSMFRQLFVALIILLIRLYRYLISPLFPAACRFHPTCSIYMEEAVSRYGIFKGAYLGLKRLLKCHPWHPGGYDPVP